MRLMRVAVACFIVSGLLSADQVTLSNGDRITGKIVKKDGDKITVKSDLMGEVTVAWSAVTSLKSEEPLTVAGHLRCRLVEFGCAGDGSNRGPIRPAREQVPIALL